MADSFSGQIAKWVEKVESARLEIFHEAAKTIASDMRASKDEGGRLPKLTGNLQRSLAASTFSMPPILFKSRKTKGAKETEFSGTLEGIFAVIDTATLDQTIWLGFQAPYANKIEQDNAFLRLSVQSWSQIVNDSAAVVKAKWGL
jgi:hypothetical protein